MYCEYCRGKIHTDDSIVVDNETWHYDCFLKQAEEDERMKENIIDFFINHVRESKYCYEACVDFYVDEYGRTAR